LNFTRSLQRMQGTGVAPGEVAVGELVDHRILEDVFVIQHVVREVHFLGHAARIVDVDPRAAGAFLGQRRAMIVKLQRHAHHVIAFFGQHRRHDRAVHAARHGHDDAGLGRRLGEAKRIERRALTPN
jgi:hypothetical protein